MTPALAVHRSALALSKAGPLTAGVKLMVSRPPSMSCQATPSLPASEYCWVLTANCTSVSVLGIISAVSRVGEYGALPAAA